MRDIRCSQKETENSFAQPHSASLYPSLFRSQIDSKESAGMYLSFNPVGTARGFQDAAWLVDLGFSAAQRGEVRRVHDRFVRFLLQEAQKCDRDKGSTFGLSSDT